MRTQRADQMADPLKVFRFGDSTMGTWDSPFDLKIKAADITRYVKDAVAVQKSKS